MYMLDDMIDMGLKDGQKWPSKAHREVAAALAICNSAITTRDALTNVVQKVCLIPKSKIKTVTRAGLSEYGLNLVCVG
jgi:hypothetical protein